MAGSLNMVQLIGNLGRDPEIRTMQNGGKLCNLSIATSESWKDKASGERKERTEWHRVVIWDEGLVRVAENYLKKGQTVYLMGQLETRKWTDQQGQEKYSTEVVLRPFNSKLTMLGSKERGGDHQQGGGQQQPQHASAGQSNGGWQQSQQPTSYGGGGGNDFEDDIPFVWVAALITLGVSLLNAGGIA